MRAAPSLASSAPDRQRANLPASLQHAVVSASPAEQDAAIARAEAALAALAVDFEQWMHSECERLENALEYFATDERSSHARERLFSAAHDMKGQAETFGYPLAGDAAAELCLLLERKAQPPPELLAPYVDAVRAIVREGIRDAAHPTGAALVRELRKLTQKHSPAPPSSDR